MSLILDRYCLEYETDLSEAKKVKLLSRVEKGQFSDFLRTMAQIACGDGSSEDPEFPIAVVKEAGEAGRGVYAKYTAKAADSIFGAPVAPYIAALDENCNGQRCYTCFVPLDQLVVSCKRCVAGFCSQTCLENAPFHEVECGLEWVRLLPVMTRMGLYLYSKAAVDLNGHTPRSTFAASEPQGPCDSRPISTIYGPDIHIIRNLFTHESILPFDGVLLHHCLDAVILAGLLDPSRLKIDKRVLLDDILRCNANAFEIVQHVDVNPTSDQEDIVSVLVESPGFALYAMPSLLNHSCNPNTVNSYDRLSNRISVRATETIPQGQQIFHCYGPAFYEMPYAERQRKLKKRYYFDCHCAACTREQLELNSPTAGLFQTDQDVDTFLLKHIKALRSGTSPNAGEAQRLEKLVKLDHDYQRRLEELVGVHGALGGPCLSTILALIETKMSKYKELETIAQGAGFDPQHKFSCGPVPADRGLLMETAHLYDEAAMVASEIGQLDLAWDMASKAIELLVNCFPKFSHDMGAEYAKLASIAQSKVFANFQGAPVSEQEQYLWFNRAISSASEAYEQLRVVSGPNCKQARQTSLIKGTVEQLKLNVELRKRRTAKSRTAASSEKDPLQST